MLPPLPTAHVATQAVFGELHQPLKIALLQNRLWSVMPSQIIPFDCVLTMCQALHWLLYVYYPQFLKQSCKLRIINPPLQLGELSH